LPQEDGLTDEQIDLLMESAHDDPGWQPGELARVEQATRFTINAEGSVSRSLFPYVKITGKPMVFRDDIDEKYKE